MHKDNQAKGRNETLQFKEKSTKSLVGVASISVIALVLVFNFYLALSCLQPTSRNENQVKTAQLTSKQERQLRDFISEEINRKHPHYSYGFGYDALKQNYACVKVHIGRDLSLNRTPSTDQGPSDYDENWAVLYFWGQWWKLGASRLED